VGDPLQQRTPRQRWAPKAAATQLCRDSLAVQQTSMCNDHACHVVTIPAAASCRRLRHDTPTLHMEAARLALCDAVWSITSSHRQLAPQVLWGQLTISQELGGLRFDVSARSFFQTNSAQAAQLVHMVAHAAGAGVHSQQLQ
jgi:tRNA/tmRNA/rRNA uracil-C5-methylase (TrmA/RlmC/RlmD family)